MTTWGQVGNKRRSVLRHALLPQLPRDFIAAKERLRDRLVPPVKRDVARAFALRKARRYQPAPAVNLVGVGVGEKVTSGERTGELCVKVLVARKYPTAEIARGDRIPARVDGIPTDVEAVGYPKKFLIENRRRQRPVPGGVSGSPTLEAAGYSFAGTLGVVVASRTNPQVLYALSNNHVLADENRITIRAGIVQPATLDGGRNADRVAELTAFVPLKFDNRRNWIDAAIAQFDGGVGVARTILGIGAPTGAGSPALNQLVRKSGRTTGMTEGIVRVVRFDVFDVEYDQGMVRIDDVIVIEKVAEVFSKPGDSGSAIVDTQGRVVGLLFAGTDTVTFAIPIRRILRRFRARVAT